MANKLLEYIRGPPQQPGEAKLLRKLDFFILTFCCLMYFSNYVSSSQCCRSRDSSRCWEDIR